MMSRYASEFHELEKIGSGEFGSVFKCVKRIDGCIYAIKRSKKPLAGSVDEYVIIHDIYYIVQTFFKRSLFIFLLSYTMPWNENVFYCFVFFV